MFSKSTLAVLGGVSSLAAADFHIGHTRSAVCLPAPVICNTPGAVQIVPSNDFDKAYQLPNLVGSIDDYGAGIDSNINACGYSNVKIINTVGTQDDTDSFFGNLVGDAGQGIGDCYWSDNASSGKNGMTFVDKIICYSDMCGK